MQKYYTVFDMTPHDEGNLGYIQIGIQDKINSNNLVYQKGAFVNVFDDDSIIKYDKYGKPTNSITNEEE